MTDLYFNILTFKQPNEKLTLYFTDKEDTNLTRLYHTLVPDEVISHFGKQEHYYTSFQEKKAGFFPVTKAVEPIYEKKVDKHGEGYSSKVRNSAFSISILKRYYNNLIHNYFKTKGFLVKPNFISDTEVWLPSKKYHCRPIKTDFDSSLLLTGLLSVVSFYNFSIFKSKPP